MIRFGLIFLLSAMLGIIGGSVPAAGARSYREPQIISPRQHAVVSSPVSFSGRVPESSSDRSGSKRTIAFLCIRRQWDAVTVRKASPSGPQTMVRRYRRKRSCQEQGKEQGSSLSRRVKVKAGGRFRHSAHLAPGAYQAVVIQVKGTRIFRSQVSRFRVMAKSHLHQPPRQQDPGLLFDGEHISDYLNQSAPGAVEEVSDPLGSGQTVFRMTVADDDAYPVTPTDNPRAQLVGPAIVTSGSDLWERAGFLLPADFPDHLSGWFAIFTPSYGPPYDGTGPVGISINNIDGTDRIAFQRNLSYGWDVAWTMPVIKDRWITIVTHQVFSPTGSLQMWIDGQPVTFFDHSPYNPNQIQPTETLQMATEDPSDDAGANSPRLMSYRQAGILNEVTIYQQPLLIGTSRASVGL